MKFLQKMCNVLEIVDILPIVRHISTANAAAIAMRYQS